MSSEPDSKRFDLRRFILVRHTSYHSNIESASEWKRSGKKLISTIFSPPHFNNKIIIKLKTKIFFNPRIRKFCSYNRMFLVDILPKGASTRVSVVAFTSSN